MFRAVPRADADRSSHYVGFHFSRIGGTKSSRKLQGSLSWSFWSLTLI